MRRALTLAVLPLFLMTASLTAFAQAAPAGPPPRPAKTAATRARSPLESSAEEIKDSHPDIPYDVLFQDMKAVQASMPAIEYIFAERGQSDGEAERATLFGWKQLRGEKLALTARLSPEELINYVIALGTLVIRSTPAGAVVELNGKAQAGRTAMVTYAAPGTYRVRLSLRGYEPVEDVCSVTEWKMTEFNKKLKPLSKKKKQP
jgi:hypothetical protein